MCSITINRSHIKEGAYNRDSIHKHTEYIRYALSPTLTSSVWWMHISVLKPHKNQAYIGFDKMLSININGSALTLLRNQLLVWQTSENMVTYRFGDEQPFGIIGLGFNSLNADISCGFCPRRITFQIKTPLHVYFFFCCQGHWQFGWYDCCYLQSSSHKADNILQ